MGVRDLSPKLSPNKNCGIHALKEATPKTGPAAITRDINERTTALEKERFEVACLRQDIIDEYEKKSAELLEYLNSMEAAFEHQRREYEQREAVLLRENKELKLELMTYGSTRLKYKAEQVLTSRSRHHRDKGSCETGRALDVLRDESAQHERNYKNEQKRVQELQGLVHDLQQEVERSEEMALRQKKRMDQTKKRMEQENEELRRKASLGWMLGCLSELYLRLDPEVGAAGIMKLVRKVQRELEAGGTTVFSARRLPPRLEYEMIQREVRRLISRAQASRTAPLRRAIEACAMVRDNASSAKPGSSVGGDIAGERGRRRWRKCNARRDGDAELTRPTASTPSTSVAPAENIGDGSHESVANCCNNHERTSTPHACRGTCQPPLAGDDGFPAPKAVRKEKRMHCEVVDLQKEGGGTTWAEIRLLDSEEASRAAAWASTLEVQKMLKGLQNSMSFLLLHERLRLG